ncbi:MAG: M28 family peptidase [Bacteroidota bacterium]
MTRTYLLILLAGLWGGSALMAQSSGNIAQKDWETHLRFLSSDELMGRRTGEIGNDIAASYIASHFASLGLEKLPGYDSYYQPIPFLYSKPAKSGNLSWNDRVAEHQKDLIIMQGKSMNWQGEAIFAGYGREEDYEGLEVEGKLVIVNLGSPGEATVQEAMALVPEKQNLARSKGAIGLVEIYRMRMSWRMATRYFGGRESMRMSDGKGLENKDFYYGWYRDEDDLLSKALQKSPQPVSLESPGVLQKIITSNNVMGVIPGSDPALKDQYLVISAHYDHVGAGNKGGRTTETDSIFNGARDNGLGTVGLMLAAEHLAAHPPKRSVLIVAVTGEEIGLLGSRYFANHPPIPLDKMVFNLNSDGAGYNDTTMYSVIGFDHLEVEGLLKEVTASSGLKTGGDPAPRQGLYDRSDNVSFASKGIPAINVSPGTAAFDRELMKYYHQVADEFESLNLSYVNRFFNAFVSIADHMAQAEVLPYWKADSKYLKAGNKLYQK